MASVIWLRISIDRPDPEGLLPAVTVRMPGASSSPVSARAGADRSSARVLGAERSKLTPLRSESQVTSWRNRKLEELFDAAVGLDPDEQAAFLDRVCADDQELRRELDELLSAYLEPSVS